MDFLGRLRGKNKTESEHSEAVPTHKTPSQQPSAAPKVPMPSRPSTLVQWLFLSVAKEVQAQDEKLRQENITLLMQSAVNIVTGKFKGLHSWTASQLRDGSVVSFSCQVPDPHDPFEVKQFMDSTWDNIYKESGRLLRERNWPSYIRLAKMVTSLERLGDAREAIKVVWASNDATLELFLEALGSQGLVPSGIRPEDGMRGARRLRDTCPEERKAKFQSLALEAFGPVTAGIQGDFSQPVTRRSGGLETVASGELEQVEFYSAANKLDALRFLESCEITDEPLQFPKQHVISGAERMTTADVNRILSRLAKVAYQGVHRFVVETPEGTWGKDVSGLYKVETESPKGKPAAAK